eukprot:6475626-Amphidinium_carterae.2
MNELLRKESELMKQQMLACQSAVQNIRNEACLFRDKVIVDAKTLCQYHVDTVKEIQGMCQGEVNQERIRLHKEAQKHQQQLENELTDTEYQQKLESQADKAVCERLQKEMDKVMAEMNSAVQSAAGSREKLEQHYKNELAEASRIIQKERTARQQLERTLEATSLGATIMSRQLEAVGRDIEAAKNAKDRYDRELTERARECGHMKEHCEALETQLRSIARALTLKGTLSRDSIEWHDGRHDLFDQLMDDCAGEMADVGDEVGEPLEGSVTALPGEPRRGIPHLGLTDGVRERLEGTVTALPGVPEGPDQPRTPENRRRSAQWSSPGFGRDGGPGRVGGPGRDGGGDDFSGSYPSLGVFGRHIVRLVGHIKRSVHGPFTEMKDIAKRPVV